LREQVKRRGTTSQRSPVLAGFTGHYAATAQWKLAGMNALDLFDYLTSNLLLPGGGRRPAAGSHEPGARQACAATGSGGTAIRWSVLNW
jgi:hypothetical protein